MQLQIISFILYYFKKYIVNISYLYHSFANFLTHQAFCLFFLPNSIHVCYLGINCVLHRRNILLINLKNIFKWQFSNVHKSRENSITIPTYSSHIFNSYQRLASLISSMVPATYFHNHVYTRLFGSKSLIYFL